MEGGDCDNEQGGDWQWKVEAVTITKLQRCGLAMESGGCDNCKGGDCDIELRESVD